MAKIRPEVKKKIVRAVIGLLIIFVVLIGVFVVCYFQNFDDGDFELGIHYAKTQADYLGLDWQETYLTLLDELKVKNIRLAAQWNEIEPYDGVWDFTNLDWQLQEAQKRGVNIVLVIGRRTPHWPECHDPEWIAGLSEDVLRVRQLQMMQKVINRYKDYKQLKTWQVENEPMLDVFGECPPSDLDFLRQEIAIVKSLDDRPILITDSGELGRWIEAASLGDLFGTTLYRVTYNEWTGYTVYRLPPIFYRIKSWLVGRDADDVYVSELQAEPWSPNGILDSPLEEQKISMDAERLINHVEYSKRIGFKGGYLWGAEWWLWLKEKQNDPSLWETAKILFNE